MWKAVYEKVYHDISKEAVWKAWADVNCWSEWDNDIEYAVLTEPFQTGSKFILKPKGAPKLSIQIIDCLLYTRFTDVTSFPFAKMFDSHELEETPAGLKIKSQISVEGPLAWLWKKIIAEGVAAGVPNQMDALVKYVQKKINS